MRYTEKDLKTKYDNFTDYLASIVELLLISPFRLVNEISKKVVYLEQKRIEKLLLVAAAIAAFVISLEVIVGIFFSQVNLLGGKFPITFQALAPLTILLIWGFVKNYDFSIHSKLEEILNNSQSSEKKNVVEDEEQINDESESNNGDENDDGIDEFDFSDDEFGLQGFSKDDEFGLQGFSKGDEDASSFNQENLNVVQNSDVVSAIDEAYEQFKKDNENFVGVDEGNEEVDNLDYDCAGNDPKQFINEEVYNNQGVKEYQNRHQATVAKLQERDAKSSKNLMFTEEELQVLQKMCNAVIESSKYIDDNTIEIALSNQKYDDFSQIDDFMEHDNVDWLQEL